MKFCYLVSFTHICYLTVNYDGYQMSRAHFTFLVVTLSCRAFTRFLRCWFSFTSHWHLLHSIAPKVGMSRSHLSESTVPAADKVSSGIPSPLQPSSLDDATTSSHKCDGSAWLRDKLSAFRGISSSRRARGGT